MRSFLKNLFKNQDGGPAIEFAVAGAFIAISFPAIIDMTTMIDSYMRLSSGMRAGEQYALKYPTDNTGIAQAIESASSLATGSVTVTTTQFCECSGLSASCTGACTYGVQLAKYNNITASAYIGARYNYGNLYPATISKNIIVRVQ